MAPGLLVITIAVTGLCVISAYEQRHKAAVWNRFVNMLPWCCALAGRNMLLLTVTPLKPGFLDRWCKKEKKKSIISFPLVEKNTQTSGLNRRLIVQAKTSVKGLYLYQHKELKETPRTDSILF